jgi:hypothetical protein
MNIQRSPSVAKPKSDSNSRWPSQSRTCPAPCSRESSSLFAGSASISSRVESIPSYARSETV